MKEKSYETKKKVNQSCILLDTVVRISVTVRKHEIKLQCRHNLLLSLINTVLHNVKINQNYWEQVFSRLKFYSKDFNGFDSRCLFADEAPYSEQSYPNPLISGNISSKQSQNKTMYI